jgi:hypothetical protein
MLVHLTIKEGIMAIILVILFVILAYFIAGLFVAKTQVPAFSWESVLKWPLILLDK